MQKVQAKGQIVEVPDNYFELSKEQRKQILLNALILSVLSKMDFH